MKNIITAIGNPILNRELKKQENITVLTNDIKYKEELLEKVIENKNIDYLIISQFIKGRGELINLLNKIKIINRKIKIIVILEKENNNLKEKIDGQKKYKIFIEDRTNINEIVNYITNSKLNNYEKKYIKKIQLINKLKDKILQTNNQKEKDKTKNKVISIIGNSQVGKTTFTLIISKLIKDKKILIIDCDFYFKEIQVILNSNKIQNYPIIKINKNLNLYNKFDKNINKQNLVSLINKLKNEFELIIFDCNYNNLLFNDILQISDKILFLMEPNLLQLKKSKELLKNKIKDKRKLKNKIKIIINKDNIYSINKEVIQKIFYDFKIIKNISYNKSYSNLINNYKCFKANKIKYKGFKKIIKNI